MANQDMSLRDELQQFGLSEKEIDVYLALLREGESKATSLASSAGVSKRFVYDVANRFEQRGFVYINDYESPTTIEPVPPEEVVSKLTEQIESLETGLEAAYEQPSRAHDRTFEIVKTRQTIEKRFNRIINDADQEVLLSIPFKHLAAVSDSLRDAVSRGVFTVVLIHEIPADASLPDVNELGHIVRAWDGTTATIAMGDVDHGLYFPPSDVRADLGLQATVYDNGYFSPLLYPTFWSGEWQAADEVHLEQPSELPRRYDRFIHAVFDALMYHRRGETLRAELSVRPARSDEAFERIEGEIVEIKHGLVKPESGTLPIQESFVINSDEEVFTVSAEGAFIEDYETEYVRLFRVNDDETERSE